MDNKLYDELDKLFESVLSFLNHYKRSEILQDEMYDIFQTNVYANIVNNIFLNLTDENIAEFEISDKDVEKFKLEFHQYLTETKEVLSFENSSLKIDSEYYNNFKSKIEEAYSEFFKLIEKFELEFNLSRLNEYLNEKKQLLKDTGILEENDVKLDMATKILESNFKDNGFSGDINLSEDFSSKFAEEYLDKSMKINEWSIWHSYSTFLLEDSYSLEEIAYKLVETGLCPLVFSQDLKIWWKEDNKVNVTILEVLERNISGVIVKWPEISDNYINEGLKQFLLMYNAESNLLNTKYRDSFDYIRCFMNACELKSGLRPIMLYPQIKIYNTGSINLTFRQISPDFEYPIDSFIMHEVNLFRNEFDKVALPMEIMKLSGRYSLHFYPLAFKLHDKIKGNPVLKKLDYLIDQDTKLEQHGDFSFYLTQIVQNNEKYYLEDIIEQFMFALSYAINTKKGEISLFSKLKYNLGDYFILRPSIYITKFKDQPDNSSQITEKFGRQIGKIMARTIKPFYMDFSKFLGENLREFDDYCLYMNKGITLFIFSSLGSKSLEEDINLSMLYEKQVQIESIDHLNISLKRLSKISSNVNLSYESVIFDQIKQISLEEFFIEEISNYGEINKIFSYASNEFNWDSIRELIDKKLKMRSEYSNVKNNESYIKIGIALTTLFGLISVPSFVDKVTNPLWIYLNLPVSTDPNLRIVSLVFITIIGILLLLGVSILLIYISRNYFGRN